MNKIDKNLEKTIVKEILEKKIVLSDIAKKYGISLRPIHRIMKENNILRLRITKDEYNSIVNELKRKEKSYEDIGKKFGLCSTTISKIAKKNNCKYDKKTSNNLSRLRHLENHRIKRQNEKEIVDNIIKDIQDGILTYNEISKKYNCSAGKVIKISKEFNVRHTNAWKNDKISKAQKNKSEYNKFDKKIIELYKEGISYKKIKEQLCVPISHISLVVKSNNLKRDVKTSLNNLKKSNLEKYGVEYVMQVKQIRDNNINAFKKNINKFEKENNVINISKIIKQYGSGWYKNRKILKIDIIKDDKNRLYVNQKYLDVIKKYQEKSQIEKSKLTSKYKYGVEYYSSTNEYKDKVKKTNKNKYGVEWSFQSENNIKKSKQTKYEKYVDENYTNQKKREETNIKKYGVKSPMQLNEIRKKVTMTQLKNRPNDPTNREKAKSTFINKYGVDNPFKDKKIKEKIRLINQERYGTDTPLQNKDIRKKTRDSLYKNGNVPCSKPQKKIYEILTGMYKDYIVELNYPCGLYNLDIALINDNIKIDIEYDGGRWHEGRENLDKKRDGYVRHNHYKILRILDNRKKEIINNNFLKEILDSINELLTTNNKYIKIEFN